MNRANEYGATALYAAAANADPGMTAKLLTAGADPNAHLLSGETSLMEAARRGNLATVRALLSGGANPNAQESNGGQTALMWAISERHSAVTEELVRRGADVHARSTTGFTVLMFAAQQGDTESARILLIFWCMFTFITSGYEHSIANMCGLMLGLLLPNAGAHITPDLYAYNLFWATVGNIVGGALFVAGL